MSDNKKYYYIKLKEDFFDKTNIKVLESLKDGYLYENIYLKMILRSLPMEGALRVSDAIPYTAESLAAVTGHEVGTVERAVKVLTELGLIELIDNDTLFINDIQNFIGKSSTNADRMRLARKEEKEGVHICAPENRDYSLETRDYSLDTKDNNIDTTQRKAENTEKRKRLDKLAAEYNRICTHLPSLTKMTQDRRHKAYLRMDTFSDDDFLAAFEKAQTSSFLSGDSGKWRASWDWFMANDKNITKVLEGNYDNREQRTRNRFEDALIPGVPLWED